MNIVVIGAGAAGLTAAARLAKSGHQVTVFDHNAKPGGVLMGWQKDGFRWDLGQLLLEGMGSGEPIGDVLSDLGIFEKVKTLKDDRRYVFPDFSITKPGSYAGLNWRMKISKVYLSPGCGWTGPLLERLPAFYKTHDHCPQDRKIQRTKWVLA